MADLRTILFIVGMLAFGMFFLEKRKPEKTWKYWRLAVIAIITSSLWSWYERFTPIVSSTEEGGLLLILLIMFFGWLLLGVYRSRSPIDL